MAKTVLIAGTASHVGKSAIATGLCRLLARRGVSVAPFKAQNMSNNARVALTPGGEWGEIGSSQYVQARAAGVVPTTDVNPVLLKPRGNGESQLIIDGQAVGHYSAGSFYEEHWDLAKEAATAAYERLDQHYDVIVAEGAGSIAEINLHERDLANVETAEIADASIVIVADIERGGVFASLYGTLELMPDHLRDRVEGVIINKFRGDRRLLETGIEELESLTGIPIIGVVPYDDPGLPAEDSVSLPSENERAVLGSDSIPEDNAIAIAIPRFPRISNFTDFEPLIHEPGVRVAYVPLSENIDDYDAIVLPGSKNTVDDLLALVEAGFDERLVNFDGPIVGICGGYQMLGERLTNTGIESTEAINAVDGLGLLPVETRFDSQKRVARVTREIDGTGPVAGASGKVTGYEIHMGHTEVRNGVDQPLGESSAATDRILGTYLHGLFDNENVRSAFVDFVFRVAGKTRSHRDQTDRSPCDQIADSVDEFVDFSLLDLTEDK